MKKFFFSVAIAVLFVVSVSSCSKAKKNYTCVCSYIATGNIISTNTVSATSPEDAVSKCDAQESAFLVGDHCVIQQ